MSFPTLDKAPELCACSKLRIHPQGGHTHTAKTPELPKRWDLARAHTQTQCEHAWKSASWFRVLTATLQKQLNEEKDVSAQC